MIRWISNSRVSLQRLGFCKLSVIVCEKCSSRGELAEKIWNILETPRPVQKNSPLFNRLKSRPKRKDVKPQDFKRYYALQELWIDDHPSRSGWLRQLASIEYFEDIGLPFLLNIIDEECHRTEFGNLLWVLFGRNNYEDLAFLTSNPTKLTNAERVLFFYLLLNADGDFLIPFLNALVNKFSDTQFSHIAAGNLLPDVIDEILQRFSSAIYTAEDREQEESLENAKNKIIDNIKKKIHTEGSGSRREQTCVPRLEWFVDLGILEKSSSDNITRKYSLVPTKINFLKKIYLTYDKEAKQGYVEEAINKILDNHFMEYAYNIFFGVKDAKSREINSIIEFLLPSYKELLGKTGYSLIKPLLLLANIQEWEQGFNTVLNYKNAIYLLEKAFQENPEIFYFTTARFGEDYQIKFEEVEL